MGGHPKRVAWVFAGIFLLCASVAQAPAADPASPRTLILALDGVPYRAVQRAQELGAFEGWPAATPVVATFPSLTNVGFTAVFRSYGAEPAGGYEIAHYSHSHNGMVGRSPFNYGERIFAWRDHFDVTGRTLGGKLSAYAAPRKNAWKTVDEAERRILGGEKETVLVHVGATDALYHLRGDRAIVPFLVKLDIRLRALKRRHLELHGRPLRVVLLSDHGNGNRKVRKAGGFRRRLRRAGFRVMKRLEAPEDVVAPTFGLVGYGALFLRADKAEQAARVVVRDESVDLAAWLAGFEEIRVISRDGEAVVGWRDTPRGRRFRYEARQGDPLRLAGAVARLHSEGQIDDEGFAPGEAWFRASALGEFPDPLRRLTDALQGPYVRNPATVIFSLRPGYAWGWVSGHVSSKLNGGRLEGTHGGLDRESSLAFLLTDDPRLQPSEPVPMERVLEPFLPPAELLASPAGLAGFPAGPGR